MVFLSEDGPYRSISSTSPAALWYSVIRLPFGVLLLLFGDNAVSPRWTKELPRGTEALEETTVFPPILSALIPGLTNALLIQVSTEPL